MQGKRFLAMCKRKRGSLFGSLSEHEKQLKGVAKSAATTTHNVESPQAVASSKKTRQASRKLHRALKEEASFFFSSKITIVLFAQLSFGPAVGAGVFLVWSIPPPAALVLSDSVAGASRGAWCLRHPLDIGAILHAVLGSSSTSGVVIVVVVVVVAVVVIIVV